MMAFRSPVEGSAGYVALEQVTGTLDGRHGSFVLQHDGLMARGAPQPLTVTIVPDSGTGERAGIAGELEIIFGAEGHRYVLEYGLGEGRQGGPGAIVMFVDARPLAPAQAVTRL